MKWKVCYADKEGRLGIRSLVALNKLCLGSGVGDLQKKGSLFGNKSSLTSLVWRKGGGAREYGEEALVWGCGKPLEENGRAYEVDPAS